MGSGFLFFLLFLGGGEGVSPLYPWPPGRPPGDQGAVVLDAGDGLALLLTQAALHPLLKKAEGAFAVVRREV